MNNHLPVEDVTLNPYARTEEFCFAELARRVEVGEDLTIYAVCNVLEKWDGKELLYVLLPDVGEGESPAFSVYVPQALVGAVRRTCLLYRHGLIYAPTIYVENRGAAGRWLNRIVTKANDAYQP